VKTYLTPDGIPVLEISAAELLGPNVHPAFTAAVDQMSAAALDAYGPSSPKAPGYADRLADLADGRD
jgi:hypothetical protein